MKKILTNGCFDVLHRGHFELLKYCKSLGYVIVALNTDNSIKKIKGNKRPIFNEKDRIFMLESCKYVDEIVLFNEETPIEIIKKIKPDIIVKGGDYKPEDVIGREIADIKIFNYIQGYSTTKTVEKINELCI